MSRASIIPFFFVLTNSMFRWSSCRERQRHGLSYEKISERKKLTLPLDKQSGQSRRSNYIFKVEFTGRNVDNSVINRRRGEAAIPIVKIDL